MKLPQSFGFSLFSPYSDVIAIQEDIHYAENIYTTHAAGREGNRRGCCRWCIQRWSLERNSRAHSCPTCKEGIQRSIFSLPLNCIRKIFNLELMLEFALYCRRQRNRLIVVTCFDKFDHTIQ